MSRHAAGVRLPVQKQVPVDPILESPALELRGIHAGYDKVEALHGIDLTVAPGTVMALLGPNGAGKTTILRVASRQITPFSGQVLVEGDDVAGQSPEKLAKGGVCTIPEGRAIFPNLTVTENLQMWTFRGLKLAEVEETAYARFPRLAERRKQVAGTMSGGEQQMLAMSRALSTKPKVLLLDEISMGLAPIIVSELYEIVAQLAAEGLSILLVEQFAYTAIEVADAAAIVSNGRIETQGTPDEIRDALVDVYLRTDAH
jgi:branched-chain amino acid transport system ATP-binding protein